MSHDATNLPKHDGDPHPDGARRFIGRSVSFNNPAGGTPPGRLVGVVESANYIGRTVRGSIPDYQLTIRGQSGRRVTVSLVESYASFSS